MRLVRYPGSKHKSVNVFFDLFPKDIEEYREPFVGGGAMYGRVWKYFKLIDRHPCYWLNDLHVPLYELYRRMKDEPGFSDRLIAIRNALTPEALHLDEIMDLVEEYKIDYYHHGDAIAYWYLMALCYGCFVRTSRKDLCSITRRCIGERPGLTRCREWKIREAKEMLQSVTQLTCHDYKQVMLAPGDNVALYCDPPYYLPNKSVHGSPLYEHSFRECNLDDHIEFLRILRACPHRVMCSYGLEPFSKRQLERMGFRVLKHPLKYTNVRRDKRGIAWEYVIMNYDSDGTRREITQAA